MKTKNDRDINQRQVQLFIWIATSCNYFLLFIVLISSCTNNINSPIKHFEGMPEEKLLPSKIYDLEEFGILRPFNFIRIENNSFVIYDVKNINLFNLVNLSSKQVIRGINKGQGTNEVLTPSSLLYRDNKILVWDAILKKMNELVVSSDTTLTLKDHYVVDTETQILFFVNQLDSTLLATGRFEDYWLVEMSKDGKIISAIDFPKWKETKNISNIALSSLFRDVKMANSPDNKRIVVAVKGFISFLDRTDYGIYEYKQIMYHPPKFAINERGSVSITGDNITGFCAVDCDDKYVYALYSGRTYKSHQMKMGHCEHLFVYDWEGNPIKHYILDIPIFNSISYDKEKNCIYGLAENPEGVLIEYQL